MSPDRPVIIAPPPLIYLGGLLAGLALNFFARAPFLPPPLILPVGLALILIGVVIITAAFRAMRRAGTTLDPHAAASVLVTAGPFRFTRNPIYLSFAVIYLGLAALANAGWALLLWPVVLLLIDRGVIAGEERHLAQKFGEAYRQYQQQVRRWI